jgi:hypothetical protein
MPDILIRDVPEKVIERFRKGAIIRDIKQCEYFSLLFDVLDVARLRAAGGDATIAQDLEVLRMGTVQE